MCSVDTFIAFMALLISIISFVFTLKHVEKSFRPIVAVMVKTHSGGNVSIAYELMIQNSGTQPAKNIRIEPKFESLKDALTDEPEWAEMRAKWLAGFSMEHPIPILLCNESTSTPFGITKADNKGFWKYDSKLELVIRYTGWFGKEYIEPQQVVIRDSKSFTHWSWG